MKLKFSFPLLLLLFPVALFSQNASYTFSINHFSLQYNNHVGNEWSCGVKLTVDGKDYRLSQYGTNSVTLSIKPSTNITITAYALESDTYPDYGSKSISLSGSDVLRKNNTEYQLNFTVREDKGRYAGNVAGWNCIIRIQKVTD